MQVPLQFVEFAATKLFAYVPKLELLLRDHKFFNESTLHKAIQPQKR
jgi:hypothetical protein